MELDREARTQPRNVKSNATISAITIAIVITLGTNISEPIEEVYDDAPTKKIEDNKYHIVS